MNFQLWEHRNGLFLLENKDAYSATWGELKQCLEDLGDDEILDALDALKNKSISRALNKVIKQRLKTLGWKAESPIFQDSRYTGKGEKAWRLDFAKPPVSLEVGFNHGEAIAWNILKPVIASDYNHVQKAVQTEVGIMITVTDAMKAAGGFDNAVGSFEKCKRYFEPLNAYLTVPMVLVGLEAPETFRIIHFLPEGQTRKRARVESLVAREVPASLLEFEADDESDAELDRD